MAARTVLIVDDDEGLREALAFVLEKKGYRVLHAGGGESLDLARRERPAMILLDLNMPDVDGAEISACLRGDARTAHIPVVAMSGEAGQRRAQAMIAQDWLRKPFSVRVLYETVARWAVPLDAAHRPAALQADSHVSPSCTCPARISPSLGAGSRLIGRASGPRPFLRRG